MGDKVVVRTAPGLWLGLAVAVLMLPLPWLGAFLLSSLIHELCHLAATKLSGVMLHELRLGADGAYLETTVMTPFQGVVCSLAGPMGGLLLLLFARWMPRTAICALIQSFYHLLPLYPLDGGRALRSLSDYFGWDDGIIKFTEGTVLLLLALGGIYLTAMELGSLPLIVTGAIIFRVCREKYLANRAGTGYNRATNL